DPLRRTSKGLERPTAAGPEAAARATGRGRRGPGEGTGIDETRLARRGPAPPGSAGRPALGGPRRPPPEGGRAARARPVGTRRTGSGGPRLRLSSPAERPPFAPPVGQGEGAGKTTAVEFPETPTTLRPAGRSIDPPAGAVDLVGRVMDLPGQRQEFLLGRGDL